MAAPSTPSSAEPFIHPHDVATLETAARLFATNPFEPAWEATLKARLRHHYVAPGWGGRSHLAADRKAMEKLVDPLGMALAVSEHQLSRGAAATPREMAIYKGAAFYEIWDEFGPRFQDLIDRKEVEAPFYDDFVARHEHLFGHPGISVPGPAHLFSLFYQARRTWYFAWTKIRGDSPSAAAARAAVWRASMGSDLCAYADGLYRKMDEIPVLITGETGTGKELAAECIGWSRYIPFDPKTKRFAWAYAAEYHARNISAVPRELIESALFGHKRGSFTGAAADALGFFALPREHGSLFLDEIGELPEHVQVKLLRPLQSRDFVPLGEMRPHRMLGRLLFATHRDLEALCREGKFRADLLERINGVPIQMPSLRQMLAEAPGDLRHYVRGFLAEKIDDPERVEGWTDRVVKAIGTGYAWPRNLRELKNWTEKYLVTGGRMVGAAPGASRESEAAATSKESTPVSTPVPSSEILGRRAKAGEVSAHTILVDYVTRAHAMTGENRSETARVTGLGWRTVGKLIDPVLLARLLGRGKKKDDGK